MNSENLKGIVHSELDIMGGTPVFVGTRVPLQNLIDSREGIESVEDFLAAPPTVRREQSSPLSKFWQLSGLAQCLMSNRKAQLRRTYNRRETG